MKILIKLHLMTILNKHNRRMLLLLSLLFIVVIFYMGFEGYANIVSDQERKDIYFQDNMLFQKPMLLFFSCYLFGIGFQNQYDQLRSVIVRGKKTRFLYLMSKIMSYLVVYSLMWLLLVGLFCAIGMFKFRSFRFDFNLLDYITSLYIYALNFGLISAIIVLLIPTDYNSLMAIIMAMVIEAITLNGTKKPLLFKLATYFMSFLESNGLLMTITNGHSYNIILSFLYIGIMIIIYFKKDLY